MASNIQIANLAITMLGGARIISFDDDTTEGRAMKATFDLVRLSELRAVRWNFAMARTTLPKLSSVPAWGYSFEYNVPTDFLALRQVNDFVVPLGFNQGRDMNDAPYQLEGRKILTDFDSPLKIRYTKDVSDPTQFDALFVQSFAMRLGIVNCETITQSKSRKDGLINDYREMRSQAVKVDAIENPPEGIYDDSWMLARY